MSKGRRCHGRRAGWRRLRCRHCRAAERMEVCVFFIFLINVCVRLHDNPNYQCVGVSIFPCVSCFFPFRPEVGITPSRQHTSALHELSARRRHALNTPQVRTSCVHASEHAHEAAVGRNVLTEGHHAVDHGRRSHGGPGSAPATLPDSKFLLVLDLCMSSLTRAPVPRGAPIAQAETLHTPRRSSSLWHMHEQSPPARARAPDEPVHPSPRRRAPPRN